MYKLIIQLSCKILITLTLITTITSCANSSNETEGLVEEEIFKELRLGMDIDEALASLNTHCMQGIDYNEKCYYNISNFEMGAYPVFEYGEHLCQYEITYDISVCPTLFTGKYNNKKIISSAVLLFHSPIMFPSITIYKGEGEYDEYNDVAEKYQGSPALTFLQANKIIKMFRTQYGKEKDNYDDEKYIWEKGELKVTLHVNNYNEDILLRGQVVDGNPYRLYAIYSYSKKMNKLIEFEKFTDEGDHIGDKL
jgi:hypothetical protein